MRWKDDTMREREQMQCKSAAGRVRERKDARKVCWSERRWKERCWGALMSNARASVLEGRHDGPASNLEIMVSELR